MNKIEVNGVTYEVTEVDGKLSVTVDGKIITARNMLELRYKLCTLK